MKKPETVYCTILKKVGPKAYRITSPALLGNSVDSQSCSIPQSVPEDCSLPAITIKKPAFYEARTDKGEIIKIHENDEGLPGIPDNQKVVISRKPFLGGLTYRDYLITPDDGLRHVIINW